MRTHILTLIVLLAALGWPSCSRSDQDEGERQSAGISPSETVHELVSCARRGDIAAYSHLVGGGTAAELRAIRSMSTFWQAVESRFPGAMPPGPDLTESLQEEFKKSEFHVRESRRLRSDQVLLTIWKTAPSSSVREETWLAVLKDGKWSLDLPGKGIVESATREGPEGSKLEVSVLRFDRLTKDRSAEIAMMNRLATFHQQLASKVSDGKYDSIDAVMAEVEEFRKLDEAKMVGEDRG